MSKEREIEAKYLLPKQAYDKIIASFANKQTFQQSNYYYDTMARQLRQHMCGLRIRVFDDHAEQTLKVPDPNKIQDNYHEVLEITDPLTLDQAQAFLKKDHPVFVGQVGRYLAEHFPGLQLQQVSWSKTERHQLDGPQHCELTLDHTGYPDGFGDYELEIENVSPVTIKQASDFLQNKYHFTPSQATSNKNKADRAWQHRMLG